MKNLTNILIVVAIALSVGLYFRSGTVQEVKYVGSPSTAGATFNTAKIATVAMAPSTASATTTSFLNTDGSDRAITSVTAFCSSIGTSKTYLTGAGLSAWSAQFSTSTSAINAKINTNYSGNLSLATSSAVLYVASTTMPVYGDAGRIWPTNTYLNVTFNATNTAACTIGVTYLGL